MDPSRAPERSAIFIIGTEGTGKTSLLRETARLARSRDIEPGPPIDGRRLSDGAGCPLKAAGLHDMLAASGRSRPARTLLTVDDAHHAAPDRLEFLMNVTRTGAPRGIIWALAGRPGADETTAGWLHAEPALADENLTIRLGSLDADAVRSMVVGLVGAPPCPELLAFVSSVGGNPLLVRELVAGLHEEGRLRTEAGEVRLLDRQRHAPHRVEVLLRNRLTRLSPRCRQLLQVAALLDEGAPLPPARLAEVLHETTAAILPVLEEAAASCLLTARDDGLAFRSPLVRSVIEGAIPDSVRCALADEIRQAATAAPQGARAAEEPAASCPERSGWKGLNTTERSIALLVSDGLTNRQIARKVFLSPHTVNYYLRRIFRKLGIASRVELATLAGEHRSSLPVPGAGQAARPA